MKSTNYRTSLISNSLVAKVIYSQSFTYAWKSGKQKRGRLGHRHRMVGDRKLVKTLSDSKDGEIESLVGLSNISVVREEPEKLWPPSPVGGSLHEGLPDVIGDTSCDVKHRTI